MNFTWRSATIVFFVVCAVIASVFFKTWRELFDLWFATESYAHGPMVPAICAWLIWRLRKPVARELSPETWWVGALGMVMCAVAWLAGDVLQISALRHFSVVGVLVCAAAACYGQPTFRALFFPIMFIFYAVPFGDFLTEPMMDHTADFVVKALQWTGIPVFREARRLVIPSGSWAVVEACSGTRYLIASVMLGSLFAYLFYRSAKRRALFVLASFVVPVVANWVRAYIIVMIGHLTDNKYGVGADHVMFGWVFFGVFIFVMFQIGARWREDDDDTPQIAPAHKTLFFARARLAPIMVATAISAIAPHLSARMIGSPAPIAIAPLAIQAPWSFEPGQVWEPVFSGERGKQAQAFRAENGAIVAFFQAAYAAQRNERRMLRFGNFFYAQSDTAAAAISHRVVTREIAGKQVTIAEIRLPERYGVRLIRATFRVNESYIASPYEAKLRLAIQTLSGKGDRSELLAWSSIGRDEDKVRAALDKFEMSFGPQLLRPLP